MFIEHFVTELSKHENKISPSEVRGTIYDLWERESHHQKYLKN